MVVLMLYIVKFDIEAGWKPVKSGISIKEALEYFVSNRENTAYITSDNKKHLDIVRVIVKDFANLATWERVHTADAYESGVLHKFFLFIFGMTKI